MKNSYLLGLLIALSIIENLVYVKSVALLLLFLFSLYSLYINNYKIDNRECKLLLPLYSLFFIAISVSLSCLGAVVPTVIGLLIKMFIIGSLFLTTEKDTLSESLGFAINFHIFVFLCHILFLILGQGQLYNSIIGIDTQTNFNESSFIPFRATGLFDEPSLFGMSIICLWISSLLLSKKTAHLNVPFFTFSVPVMVVISYSRLITSKSKGVLFKISIIFLLFFAGFVIYQIAVDREKNVKESPLGLRTSHYVFLYESPNLLTGSGFCSAYGKFSLDLDRDSLREYSMANFKDAGQVAYSIDRSGLLFFCIFCVFLYRHLGWRYFSILFVYLALSKVPIISVASVILFSSCFKYKPNIVE